MLSNSRSALKKSMTQRLQETGLEYRHPPLTQRIIVLFFKEMDEPFFSKAVSSWQDKIRDEFPLHKKNSKWTLNVKAYVSGVPVIKNEAPILDFHYVYSNTPDPSEPIAQIQCRADRVAFHFQMHNGHIGSFKDLFELFQRYIGLWCEHFSIDTFTGVALEYYNAINETLTKDFYKNGILDLGLVFRHFGSFDERLDSLVPPFRVELNFRFVLETECIVQLLIIPDEKIGNGFHVTIIGRTMRDDRQIDLQAANSEILMSHQCVLDVFHDTFADNAKQTFEKK